MSESFKAIAFQSNIQNYTVRLSDEEKIVRRENIMDLMDAMDRDEELHKETLRLYREQKKRHKDRISALRKSVRSGFEEQSGLVHLVMNEKNMVDVYDDNGVLIQTRRPTLQERQLELQ
jgi:hypothetical protein